MERPPEIKSIPENTAESLNQLARMFFNNLKTLIDHFGSDEVGRESTEELGTWSSRNLCDWTEKNGHISFFTLTKGNLILTWDAEKKTLTISIWYSDINNMPISTFIQEASTKDPIWRIEKTHQAMSLLTQRNKEILAQHKQRREAVVQANSRIDRMRAALGVLTEGSCSPKQLNEIIRILEGRS